MNAPVTTYLKDYQAPAFSIDKTELKFELFDQFTRVTSNLSIRRNSQNKTAEPLVLDGCELTLESISIDGVTLSRDRYQESGETLTLDVPDQCVVTCVTTIKPHLNTLLEGLYRSSGMYCTQCEAEGFRRITYYLDRPDVMSEFITTVVADKKRYPVLLSNGNLVASGDIDDEQEKQEEGGYQRHWAKWHDPFKKPAYLFALVAGDLDSINDTFITASGREVELVIYVEAKDIDKCDHAMASLKKSMRWDEEVFGREYDLDLFMIVAVDDFNMGAMENKGLNIFNTSCVLANPVTTTDSGFDRVESIVAHEYFHNWSGNRITCRDWFQLSLKEGFTVFRDTEFSSDMGSRTVRRVDSVKVLRTAQFAEDAGPMSHPVQPDSYIEISNFYTLTIYEKGAEIVRMIHTLLGPELFRKGSDLYFDLYDGQAVTIHEFVESMASVSGRDFSQFMNWYKQAGTPGITITDEYDPKNQSYQLSVTQNTRSGDSFHIPLALGLIGSQGDLAMHCDSPAYNDGLIELTENNQTFTFTKVKERPTPSLFRNFSAPITLKYSYSQEDYARLIQFDSDGFNRWNASHELAIEVIHNIQSGMPVEQASQNLLNAFEQVIGNTSLDKAMVALMLTLPSEAYLSQIAAVIDVEAIHSSRKILAAHIAEAFSEQLWDLYHDNDSSGAYEFTGEQVARREIKNRALSYLMLANTERARQTCLEQYHRQHNMTDTLTALTLLVHNTDEALTEVKTEVLNDFYSRFKHETLVINLWLSVQASIPAKETINTVKSLLDHPSFDANNPNKIRSVIGIFCSQNPISFHQPEGYQLLVDQVCQLNKTNPQIAARIITPLTRFRRYAAPRQQQMKEALKIISESPELSKDVFEVVSKSLLE